MNMAIRNFAKVSGLALAGLLVTMQAGTAAAATVNAVYRVSLTDPATGVAYYVDRTSIRSWDSVADCERDKKSFRGFHTAIVEGFDIKNGAGQPLEVKLASSHCLPPKGQDD